MSIAIALLLASCGAAREIRELETLGVRVQSRDSGWFRLRSDAGYSFELPGVPLAARQEYGFGSVRVRTIFYDLDAEMSSRGYLLRAFDARELDEAAREELRELAEAQIADAGEQVSSRREVREAGITMHEAVVEGVSIHDHLALVRTFVRGDFVFQLVAIILRGGGEPHDAYRFFRSVRIDDEPRASAIPEDPALIPAEAPED